MLSHQQVLQHGQILEQAHILEGAHQPFSRHFMAGHAVYRLAVHGNDAGGRLVETAHAIEYRGLARAVGANDGEDLVLMNVELHPVDGQEAAEAHGEIRDLQQDLAHYFNSTCGRFMGSRPCGRHIIIRTITRPKIIMRYSANSRATSGSTVSTMAARITPTCEPMPPSTTMASMSADSKKVKDSGLTKPWRAAKNAPPKPAKVAPMVNAQSFTLVGLRPSERQAISSSRKAAHARPMGMRITRLDTNSVNSASASAIRYR